MYSSLNICLIGDGGHSKRIQKILKKNKILFTIYKPISKKNYIKENIDHLKKFDAVFIISPDYTHTHYIKKLFKHTYIFCEKPPCNNKKDLSYLSKINLENIYFNFNYRFSNIFEALKKRNKYNLGKLLYANIINGHAFALKKDYINNYRSNKKKSPNGILEVVTIHFIDLINYIFDIKEFKISKMKSLSKYGSSYDNSIVQIISKENSFINIYNSWTTQLINSKKFIFENGSIEEEDNVIIIRGPALNLNRNNLTIKPKIKKKIINPEKNEGNISLEKSIKFFLQTVKNNKKFSKKDNKKSLIANKLIL